MSGIEEALSYWLEPVPTTAEAVEAKKKFWFDGGSEVDREIKERFAAQVERARGGELDAWTETPRGTLALIVLVDQFSRNLHRGAPSAFSHDPKALRLASDGYDTGRFDGFGTIEHFFASMPFRHAEDVETQKRGVARAVKDALGAEPLLRELMIYSVDWARKHLDVIVRFGRFPHRNATLGRASTPAELEYLEYLRIAGQWL